MLCILKNFLCVGKYWKSEKFRKTINNSMFFLGTKSNYFYNNTRKYRTSQKIRFICHIENDTRIRHMAYMTYILLFKL